MCWFFVFIHRNVSLFFTSRNFGTLGAFFVDNHDVFPRRLSCINKARGMYIELAALYIDTVSLLNTEDRYYVHAGYIIVLAGAGGLLCSDL